MMDGIPAMYLGRIVPKEGFRTNIYAPNGSQKIVESWEEFESHMESGTWFASKEDAKACVVSIAPDIKVEREAMKKDKISGKKKDEDFLPKARK
jgi:hypothetical protein